MDFNIIKQAVAAKFKTLSGQPLYRTSASKDDMWATRAEQSRNTSRTILVDYNGKTQCLKDWAKELNINYSNLVKQAAKLGALAAIQLLDRKGSTTKG